MILYEKAVDPKSQIIIDGVLQGQIKSSRNRATFVRRLARTAGLMTFSRVGRWVKRAPVTTWTLGGHVVLLYILVCARHPGSRYLRRHGSMSALRTILLSELSITDSTHSGQESFGDISISIIEFVCRSAL